MQDYDFYSALLGLQGRLFSNFFQEKSITTLWRIVGGVLPWDGS